MTVPECHIMHICETELRLEFQKELNYKLKWVINFILNFYIYLILVSL